MKVFLARQPILDTGQKLFGYELLFRNSEANIYNGVDGDTATLEVIRNSFVHIGLNKVTQGKKAFINFTENILKSDIFLILSPKDVVVEILENIEPTEEVIQTCYNLKQHGFTIALDDFVFEPKYEKLIAVADIIKVDFRITKGYERQAIIERIGTNKIKFLAEKVESIEEYRQALKLGYSYFQGYFFSKPLMLSVNRLPENKIVYLRILKLLNSQEFNIEELEDLIKKDVSLSFKLLKLINSAKYTFKSTISSMKQAMVILGEVELKKWLYVIVMQSIGADKAECLINESLVRARLMELLANKVNSTNNSFYAYLIGMLSEIDILLGAPLNEVLDELVVPNEVKEVLIDGKMNDLGIMLALIKANESKEWDKVRVFLIEYKIDEEEFLGMFLEAIDWANE